MKLYIVSFLLLFFSFNSLIVATSKFPWKNKEIIVGGTCQRIDFDGGAIFPSRFSVVALSDKPYLLSIYTTQNRLIISNHQKPINRFVYHFANQNGFYFVLCPHQDEKNLEQNNQNTSKDPKEKTKPKNQEKQKEKPKQNKKNTGQVQSVFFSVN